MKAPERASKEEIEESLSEILSIALKDPSYMMIFVGFFSCGYQLAFITAHFPALITEMSAPIDPTGWCGDLGIETTVLLGIYDFSNRGREHSRYISVRMGR